jgi:hypothetical protein
MTLYSGNHVKQNHYANEMSTMFEMIIKENSSVGYLFSLFEDKTVSFLCLFWLAVLDLKGLGFTTYISLISRNLVQ